MVKVPRPNGHGSYWASPDGTSRGVRKGEKSTDVVRFKRVIKPDPDDPEAEPRVFMLAGIDHVFNAAQADWPEGHRFAPKAPEAVPEPADLEEMPEAEEVMARYLASGGPALRNVYQDRAYYQSGPDMITLPERRQFKDQAEYWSTAFHEAGHSTGHPKRNNREGIAEFDHFGSGKYGREELVAEMTAAMLAAYTGITVTFDNSAAYLGSWVKEIKGDTHLIIKASTEAQAALDLITGETEGSEVTPEESGTYAPQMAVAA